MSGTFSAEDTSSDEKKIFPRSYFARDLHVYLTLTNLRGVPYAIDFNGLAGAEAGKSEQGSKRSRPYMMLSHSDFAHYRLTGIGAVSAEMGGAVDFVSPWAGVKVEPRDWPAVGLDQPKDFARNAFAQINNIADKLLEDDMGIAGNIMEWMANFFFGRNIKNALLNPLIKDLVLRNQLEYQPLIDLNLDIFKR